jgi:hypothetical protein
MQYRSIKQKIFRKEKENAPAPELLRSRSSNHFHDHKLDAPTVYLHA